MYNQPYFIPSYYSSMAAPSMMRGAMGMGGALRGAGAAAGASRGLGLFSRLGSGLSAFRGINWGGLITNASKTLGVINQTIPLVRQVGPMFNNMRSMLRVASIFKDETDKNPSRSTSSSVSSSSSRSTNNFSSNNRTSFQQEGINSSVRTSDSNINETRSQVDYTSHKDNDHSPTFFIET